MKRTTILNPKEIKRTTFREAEEAFFKHCKLKNLRPRSIEYYREDLHFFHTQVPVRYVDEITQEMFEDFIVNQLEQGKTSPKRT